MFFPRQGNATFGAAAGKTVGALNDVTDGWFVNTTRLLWVNGLGPCPLALFSPIYLSQEF